MGSGLAGFGFGLGPGQQQWRNLSLSCCLRRLRKGFLGFDSIRSPFFFRYILGTLGYFVDGVFVFGYPIFIEGFLGKTLSFGYPSFLQGYMHAAHGGDVMRVPEEELYFLFWAGLQLTLVVCLLVGNGYVGCHGSGGVLGSCLACLAALGG